MSRNGCSTLFCCRPPPREEAVPPTLQNEVHAGQDGADEQPLQKPPYPAFILSLVNQSKQLAEHMPDSTASPDKRALVGQAVQWFNRSKLTLDALGAKLAKHEDVQENAAKTFGSLLAALTAAVPQLEDNVFALPLAQTVTHFVHLLFKCFGIGGRKPALEDWKEHVDSWQAQVATIKAALHKLGPDLPTSEIFVQLALTEEGISLLTSVTAEGVKTAARALFSIGKSIVKMSPDTDLIGSLTAAAHFGVK